MTKVILVVEDDAAIRELLVTTLQEVDSEYQVIAAEHGKQALERVKDIKVHLITLDLEMPIMDGNTFLEKFSAIDANVPVVVISANASKLANHPQVKATIAKPFDLDDLLHRVTLLVGV